VSAALPLPPDEATVAAYLGNQLPEPQAEAFEIYCLNHPEFARKVELDLCMKRGLREIGVRDSRARTRLRFRPLWVMAAGLGAAVTFGLLLFAWSQWHVGLIAYRNLSEVPLQLRTGVFFDVTLLRLRGSDAEHRVIAPRGSGLLKLKIFPDSAPGQQGYSAAIMLDSITGSRPVVIKQLHPDAEGFLELYLPLSDLVGHTLKITIASDSDRTAAPAPAFRLQVVAAAN
jgi:hypothetical protein